MDFDLDLDVDLDLDMVAAAAGMNSACQMSHRQELVSLETVHVLERETGVAPKETFCDRNELEAGGQGGRPEPRSAGCFA